MPVLKTVELFILFTVLVIDIEAQITDTVLIESTTPTNGQTSEYAFENITQINNNRLNGQLEPTTLEILPSPYNGTVEEAFADSDSPSDSSQFSDSTETSTNFENQDISITETTESLTSVSYGKEEITKNTTDGLKYQDMTNDRTTSANFVATTRENKYIFETVTEKLPIEMNEYQRKGDVFSKEDTRDFSVSDDDVLFNSDDDSDETLFELTDTTDKDLFEKEIPSVPIKYPSQKSYDPLTEIEKILSRNSSELSSDFKVNEKQLVDVTQQNVDSTISSGLIDSTDSSIDKLKNIFPGVDTSTSRTELIVKTTSDTSITISENFTLLPNNVRHINTTPTTDTPNLIANFNKSIGKNILTIVENENEDNSQDGASISSTEVKSVTNFYNDQYGVDSKEYIINGNSSEIEKNEQVEITTTYYGNVPTNLYDTHISESTTFNVFSEDMEVISSEENDTEASANINDFKIDSIEINISEKYSNEEISDRTDIKKDIFKSEGNEEIAFTSNYGDNLDSINIHKEQANLKEIFESTTLPWSSISDYDSIVEKNEEDTFTTNIIFPESGTIINNIEETATQKSILDSFHKNNDYIEYSTDSSIKKNLNDYTTIIYDTDTLQVTKLTEDTSTYNQFPVETLDQNNSKEQISTTVDINDFLIEVKDQHLSKNYNQRNISNTLTTNQEDNLLPNYKKLITQQFTTETYQPIFDQMRNTTANLEVDRISYEDNAESIVTSYELNLSADEYVSSSEETDYKEDNITNSTEENNYFADNVIKQNFFTTEIAIDNKETEVLDTEQFSEGLDTSKETLSHVNGHNNDLIIPGQSSTMKYEDNSDVAFTATTVTENNYVRHITEQSTLYSIFENTEESVEINETETEPLKFLTENSSVEDNIQETFESNNNESRISTISTDTLEVSESFEDGETKSHESNTNKNASNSEENVDFVENRFYPTELDISLSKEYFSEKTEQEIETPVIIMDTLDSTTTEETTSLSTKQTNGRTETKISANNFRKNYSKQYEDYIFSGLTINTESTHSDFMENITEESILPSLKIDSVPQKIDQRFNENTSTEDKVQKSFENIENESTGSSFETRNENKPMVFTNEDARGFFTVDMNRDYQSKMEDESIENHESNVNLDYFEATTSITLMNTTHTTDTIQGYNNSVNLGKNNTNFTSEKENVSYINTNILGNYANLSILVIIQDTAFYIPSNARINDKSSNPSVNITWTSLYRHLNNSLYLALIKDGGHYSIKKIQLNLLQGNKIDTWNQEVVTSFKDTSGENGYEIKFTDDVRILFSNLEFLRQHSDEEFAPSKINVYKTDVAIASGSIAAAIIICAALYVVISKSRKRTLNIENMTKHDIPV